jgi:hypothetical protein
MVIGNEFGLLLEEVFVCFVVLGVFCYLSFGVMRLPFIIKSNHVISILFLISFSLVILICIIERLMS